MSLSLASLICHIRQELASPEYPHVQKLYEELKSDGFPADGVLSIQKIDSLHYIDVAIKGHRLFAIIPMALFREVAAEGKPINRYTLPGRTIVGSQGYSLHRNEA